MKNSILFLLIVFSYTTLFSQSRINVQGEQCSHCNMMIKDPLFAAVAVNENKRQTFDAIECLVNFLKENDETSFDGLWVADYSNNGTLIKAQSATYLKSKAIASPMGAYISGYSTKGVAKKVQTEKGGELYSWLELKELFKDSRFGLLDHPTHHHHSPGAYAPIGIMGDHLHHQDGIMFSLRYMDMNMNGNLRGSVGIENKSIFQDYMVAPQTMTMHMYMLGAMYAPSDKLTLMVMQNLVENTMSLQNMAGMDFSTSSKGFGDLRISALYGLIAKEKSSFHLNAIINLPVGEIQNRDNTPIMDQMKLPYPMQLGSGTVDITLGGTYKGSNNHWSWGFQSLGTIRTGENSEGYRIGDQLDINGWTSYDIATWMSISARVMSSSLGKLVGNDDELNPMMAPPANAMNTGFTKVRTFIGVNWSLGDQPTWRNFKIGVEYGLPIYQNVNGIQMMQSSTLNAGFRYSI